MKYLYHTRPKQLLPFITETDPVFIEIDPCLQDISYLGFFASKAYLQYNTILDCGVGASPDLNNPTAHVSDDPHWAARYLHVLLKIRPHVVVVPDVLGNARRTRDNFLYYYNVISHLNMPRTNLMYVIQGQTEEEALEEINWVCKEPLITWVGFPRIVHYYKEDLNYLSSARIRFVDFILDRLRSVGKQVHLLGMNDIKELEWAGTRSISVDTRMASMAALTGCSVIAPRPLGLKIDLTKSFTLEIQESILDNINTLNNIYHNKAKHV